MNEENNYQINSLTVFIKTGQLKISWNDLFISKVKYYSIIGSIVRLGLDISPRLAMFEAWLKPYIASREQIIS